MLIGGRIGVVVCPAKARHIVAANTTVAIRFLLIKNLLKQLQNAFRLFSAFSLKFLIFLHYCIKRICIWSSFYMLIICDPGHLPGNAFQSFFHPHAVSHCSPYSKYYNVLHCNSPCTRCKPVFHQHTDSCILYELSSTDRRTDWCRCLSCWFKTVQNGDNWIWKKDW